MSFERRTAWVVPVDHPAFAGHFPGQPILPGVVLLSQVVESGASTLGSAWMLEGVQIGAAKFLSPVLPGDACEIVLSGQEAPELATKIKFEVRRGDTLCASGTLARGPEPSAMAVQPPTATTAKAADNAAAEPAAKASTERPSPSEPPADKKATAAWAKAPERSNATVLKLMAWIAVTFGRRMARWLLVPISLYYLLFSPQQAKQSRRFLKRVFGRDANWIDGYRHIHTFASTILDRVYFLRVGTKPFDISVHGSEALHAAAREDPGAFLVGGHLGSFEVMRVVGDHLGSLDVAMVMYPDNAQKINDTLKAIAPEQPVPIIALGRLESMLSVRDWLDRGGVAGMLGDRMLAEDDKHARLVRAPFLGVEVDFIDGPMRLAALLRRRVFFMAGIYRGGNRYEVHFRPIVDFRDVKGPQREAAIREGVLAYVRELEAQARDAPYNWFNFHDFWREDGADGFQPPDAQLR
jgi:predicted LPLAT superfamily acyltransferase